MALYDCGDPDCIGCKVQFRQSPRPRVVTNHVYPPIPIRSFDWSARRDGYEPPDLIGWGTTEKEAIRDLMMLEHEAKIIHRRTCSKLDESGAFNCNCGAA